MKPALDIVFESHYGSCRTEYQQENCRGEPKIEMNFKKNLPGTNPHPLILERMVERKKFNCNIAKYSEARSVQEDSLSLIASQIIASDVQEWSGSKVDRTWMRDPHTRQSVLSLRKEANRSTEGSPGATWIIHTPKTKGSVRDVELAPHPGEGTQKRGNFEARINIV